MGTVVSETMVDSTNASENNTVDETGEDTEVDLSDLAKSKRENGADLELGEVFEQLQNERRRQVIQLLKEQEDGVTTLDVLAEHIAAAENDIEIAQLSSSQRKRVYIGLYQCHLPKMDDFGVIEYDKNRGRVELQDTSQLDQYLEGPNNRSKRPRDLYIAVSVAAVVLVGVTGLGPLAIVPTVIWTLISVATLLALAVIS